MVVAIVCGGSAPQACPTVVGSSRSPAWRSAFPKVFPGSVVKHTQHIHSGRPDVQPRPACAVLSETAPPSTDIRSADLNDMCTLQLGMLYQLLARAGKNYSSMRCTVYARNFTTVGPGQVKLVQVARFPVVAGHQDEQQTQNTLLLHTEQSWALQGGSAAVDPSAMIEDCLLQREVVALPSSSALVFPLVDCGVLVGLLVVELEVAAAQEHWGPAAGNAGAAVTAAMAPALPGAGMSAATAVHTPGIRGLSATEKVAQRPAQAESGAAGTGGRDSGDSSLRMLAKLEAAACEAHDRPRQGLTDEELQCLRLAVPLLSKACGMDARASWQLTQNSISAAAAAGLLREAQRPLSTLNTFSAMLMPRLKDGEPDKDMAKGILLQGKRLQDLIWQLEEALHGVALQGHTAAAAAAASMLHVSAMGLPPGTAGHPHTQAAIPAPPFRSSSALPRDPSPAVQELLQLPRPRPAALPPSSDSSEPLAAATASAHHPADSLVPSARSPTDADNLRNINSAPCITTDGTAPAPVLPGRVTFIDRTSAAASSPAADSTLGAFTIRMPTNSIHGRPPHVTGQPVTAREGGSDRPYTLGSHGASMATIDVEMDKAESTSSSDSTGADIRVAGNVHQAKGHHRHHPHTPSSNTTWGWGPSQLHGAGNHLAAALSTNLVSALAGVLTAACKLAAVSGIGFIVNSPLSAVLSKRSTSGGAAGVAPVKAGARSKSSSSPTASGGAPSEEGPTHPAQISSPPAVPEDSAISLPGPRLIPRPPRPLLVGVRAALVQKVVGYMLDIALQCTPRGGQVCVSARQDGAGVQVQVLHSGRMDLQRLHMRSRALTPAALHASAGVRNDAARGAGEQGGAGLIALGSRSVATEMVAQTSSMPTVAVSGSASGQSGSGVLSVEMAQELAQQAGGHLTVSYPFNMVNVKSGNLDVGTSVEIWLPGPAAGN